jgi:hypothetical protein
VKHVVYKFFSIGAHEKEEKWLNEMSAKGMVLTDVMGLRYVFEQGTPGEYIYRLELLNYLPSHAESIAYVKFMEDMGIEYVGSCLRWVYFRKQAQDGVFEIYSDIESKIKHLKRITWLANLVSSFSFCMAIIYLWEAWNQYSVYSDWLARGFSGDDNYISPFIWGIMFIVFIAMFQIFIIPVRRSLRRLKTERKLRE